MFLQTNVLYKRTLTYTYLLMVQDPSAICRQSIKPLSVLHSGLKGQWQPILTPQQNSKKKNSKKNFYKSFFYATYRNFLVLTLLYFLKNVKIFCPQKVEKTTLKSCSEKLKSTFFPCCPELPRWPKQKNSCSRMWLID